VPRRRLGIGWQVGFWAIACAILIYLLWLFSAVLLPFIMAIVVGYLLDPLVNKLEKMGMGRAAAVSVILVGSLVVIIVVLTLFAPMLVRQVSGFVKALPDLINQAQGLVASISEQFAHGWGSTILAKLGIDGGGVAELKNSVSDLANKGVAWLVAFGNGVLSRGAALLDLFSLLIITPVVGFYMLLDWRKMVETIDGLVPPRDRETVRAIAHDIDLALAGFLRGQSLVCLFLAAWYGIGLTLIGLNFGLLIGIIGGLLSFVPYVGSLVVLVLALLIATVQGWPSWHLPALALGIVLVGQFLEGNVLSPKLVGDKVGLHPVWIIFALLAFGSVWGFTGLIVAVPVASAIGVLLRFATVRYRQSPIYTGEIPATPTPVLTPPAPAQLSSA
jgi:predicted PurR-regulated permease PerM